LPDVLIKDMHGLEKLINMTIQQALNFAADETIRFLKKYIENYWYKHYPDSQYYDRQFDLLHSAVKSKVKKVGNGYQIEVYLDPGLLNSEERPDGEFNARMSVDGSTSWKGIPLSEAVVMFIEEGFHIPFANNKEFKGVYAIQNTREWLVDEIDGIFNKAFNKAGFQLSVVR
jgi:hypothetical protein